MPTPTEPRTFRRRKDGEVDRRALRRTGRTTLLAIRVTEEFNQLVRRLAAQEGRTLGEFIEVAVFRWQEGQKVGGKQIGPNTAAASTELSDQVLLQEESLLDAARLFQLSENICTEFVRAFNGKPAHELPPNISDSEIYALIDRSLSRDDLAYIKLAIASLRKDHGLDEALN
jgi:hypothetical protein